MPNEVNLIALSKIAGFFPDCNDIEQATLESLHVDSFMFIQIVLSLESTFGFEFEDAMFEPGAFQTFGQLAFYVEKRVSNGSSKKPTACTKNYS
jgi:acyl carrier protein